MAKGNLTTEQLTDTPKTAVEQAETIQSVPQTIVKKRVQHWLLAMLLR